MAIHVERQAQYIGHFGGGADYLVDAPEAAGQTFTADSLVYLATSGKSTTLANNGQTVWGQSLVAASGTTDTALNTRLITPDTLFSMVVFHGTPASALTHVDQVGQNFGVEVVAFEAYYAIDEETTIALRVLDLELRTGMTVGDKWGSAIVKFISTYCQTDIAG